MNLQESIRRILKEETSYKNKVIKQILDHTIMKDYEDLICDIIVINNDDDDDLVVKFIFLRRREPRRLSDYDIYLQIVNEAGDLIYDYTNMEVYLQQTYVKKCN